MMQRKLAFESAQYEKEVEMAQRYKDYKAAYKDLDNLGENHAQVHRDLYSSFQESVAKEKREGGMLRGVTKEFLRDQEQKIVRGQIGNASLYADQQSDKLYKAFKAYESFNESRKDVNFDHPYEGVQNFGDMLDEAHEVRSQSSLGKNLPEVRDRRQYDRVPTPRSEYGKLPEGADTAEEHDYDEGPME